MEIPYRKGISESLKSNDVYYDLYTSLLKCSITAGEYTRTDNRANIFATAAKKKVKGLYMIPGES